MKVIKFSRFAILFTILFLQGFHAFGHLPCGSERDDVMAAERNLDHAKQDLKVIKTEIALLHIEKAQTNDPLVQMKLDLEITMKSRKRDNELQPRVDTAQQNVNNARASRDLCIENDRRDCPGNCSKLHTQNNTSCECNCEYSNSYGCECGALF